MLINNSFFFFFFSFHRADIKQYIGPPSVNAIFSIYHSCITELMRVRILLTILTSQENETNILSRCERNSSFMLYDFFFFLSGWDNFSFATNSWHKVCISIYMVFQYGLTLIRFTLFQVIN